MNITDIICFSKFLKTTIETISNKISDKTKIITFKDIIYCCLYMNGSSCSYSLANINMCMNDIIDVSDTALKKKRNSFDYSYFKQISDNMINFIYENDNNPRIIAVDGTYIPLSINLQNYGFQTSQKSTYCIGLISSLFDVNKKMLINYNLCKKHDERKALIQQIDYLRPKDVLVMDRGYYSIKLLFYLHERKIDVIFRMQSNSLLVKKIIEKGQSSMITTITNNSETMRFRIVTYKIGNNDYFLGTTIMNKTVAYFKNIYWKRWTVEINFRESKYLLSLNNIQSKSVNKIQQDIYSHHILFMICSYFKNKLSEALPINKHVNTKNLFHLIVTSILYLIIYKKLSPSTKKNLKKCYHAY
jgi:hypothetical protein